jgi:hypothetical protein
VGGQRRQAHGPDVDAGLHPALPIRQRLDDELVFIVRREVGAVMHEPVHGKIAFLGREESGSCRVLWTFQTSRTKQGIDGMPRKRTSCMIKYAILATTTVARPSSKNCAPILSPHRRWRDNERGNIQSKPTHATPRSLPSPQYQRPVSHRTHRRRSLQRRRVRRASTVRCAYTRARGNM